MKTLFRSPLSLISGNIDTLLESLDITLSESEIKLVHRGKQRYETL